MESLSIGNIPRVITVILEADLADRVNAGDDVVISGTIVRRWSPVFKGARCSVDVAIKANRQAAIKFCFVFYFLILHLIQCDCVEYL